MRDTEAARREKGQPPRAETTGEAPGGLSPAAMWGNPAAAPDPGRTRTREADRRQARPEPVDDPPSS